MTTALEVAVMLLDRGANPNMQLKLFPPYRSLGQDRGGDSMLTVGTTPLIRAAKSGDIAAVKLLLEHGASQAARLAAELVGLGYARVVCHRDLAGHDRVTEAVWP